MLSKTQVDIDREQDFNEIIQLIKAFSSFSDLNTEDLKRKLDLELEEKRQSIMLSPHDIMDFVLDNFVDRSKYITLNYKWSPSELFEKLQRFFSHNIIVKEEEADGHFWDFSISISEGGEEIEWNVQCPEEIIDNIINPLLSKKTDLQVIYPKGNQNSEIHIFCVVKREVAKTISDHPMFVV